MIQRREVGCEELLDHYLDRVERFNPTLNAIVVLDADGARERARAADAALARGEVWGPLHGVPMTIKESYNVAGTPTTWGMPDLSNNIAAEDALSVQRLKAAGVVLFGKTNVPLGLADFQSYNEIYGTTSNPWDTDRIPGGSSGGSAAALAAGMTGFESGSDIGGSIRNPAHYCGVFGHKPTWGLLPPRGHAMPGVLAQPDLSVIGPLGRGASDLELGVTAMAGPDEIQGAGYELRLRGPEHRDLSGLSHRVLDGPRAGPGERGDPQPRHRGRRGGVGRRRPGGLRRRTGLRPHGRLRDLPDAAAGGDDVPATAGGVRPPGAPGGRTRPGRPERGGRRRCAARSRAFATTSPPTRPARNCAGRGTRSSSVTTP